MGRMALRVAGIYRRFRMASPLRVRQSCAPARQCAPHDGVLARGSLAPLRNADVRPKTGPLELQERRAGLATGCATPAAASVGHDRGVGAGYRAHAAYLAHVGDRAGDAAGRSDRAWSSRCRRWAIIRSLAGDRDVEQLGLGGDEGDRRTAEAACRRADGRGCDRRTGRPNRGDRSAAAPWKR